MDTVFLNNSGKLHGGHHDKTVSDPLSVLASHVILDEGFTLRGFTRMLVNYPELQRLSEFAPQLAVLSTEEEGSCALECLEFSRVVEIIGAPGPPKLEVYYILRGRAGDDANMEIRAWQIQDLLDIPLCFGPLRHVVFGDVVQDFMFASVCTLFDFIDGIVWQLAFHGAPEECALRR